MFLTLRHHAFSAVGRQLQHAPRVVKRCTLRTDKIAPLRTCRVQGHQFGEVSLKNEPKCPAFCELLQLLRKSISKWGVFYLFNEIIDRCQRCLSMYAV